MKVAMISYYHVSLEAGGGVGVQIRKTAEYLRKLGVTVELFDPWKPFSVSDFDLYHFFPAHPFFEHFACRVLKPMNAKIVVSPVYWPQYSIPLETAWTRVTGMIPQMFSGRSLMRSLMKTADILLPNSHIEGEVISKIYGIPKERMRVVPNGTDLSFLQADPTLFEQTYPFRKFALYVGNIGYARKNHDRLLQAWEHIDLDLVLIGNALKTPYTDKVMRTVEQNERIHYLGFLQHDDPLLASAYAASDLFILPGAFETPGLAALEAGLAGAKVAVTSGGSTREYFGDYAAYLNPESVPSIRSAVQQAIAQDRSPELQNHLSANFSWEQVALKTLEAYSEVLSRS